jgi:hypothetical protein
LARRVQQVAVAGEVSEGGGLQRRRPRAEPHAVEYVERFGANIDADFLLEREALGDGKILVQIGEKTYLGVVDNLVVKSV